MHMGKIWLRMALLAGIGLGITAVAEAQQRSGDIFPTLPSTPPNYQAPRLNQNPSAIRVARLHYNGGGDWYWGSSAIPNFLRFVRDNTDFVVDTMEYQVTITDPDLFKYPFLFATGHGIIKFSPEEKERLRQYLGAGGFLFVNDSYGMDKPFRQEMATLFPERELVELPFDHPIYHSFFDFPAGPPKIHEHDNKPPRGYAMMVNGRAVLYFLVESDIGDGWEDPQVHNDPPDKRNEALRMGLNLLTYALLY
jgi:hypothetical protein